MATRDRPTFEAMCRAFPIRTFLFTFGPLLVGVAQSLNAVAHGANLWLVALIAVATVAYSILVTNYHLASFRRRTVCRGIE